MHLDLDVDCGQVLRGHELRFTGLRLDGTSGDVVHRDFSEHHPGKPVHPMVSLTYTLTPEVDDDALPQGRDVDVTVVLDPPADPAHWAAVLPVGGERDGPRAAGETRGAFGPFVLPAGTKSIAFALQSFGVWHDRVAPEDDGPQRTLGTLRVDLVTRSARWRPVRGGPGREQRRSPRQPGRGLGQ